MITAGVLVERKGWPAMSRRDMRQITRSVMQAIGMYWDESMLPRHFEETAKRRYGYKARGKKYQAKKRRRRGHTKPLVNTGEMQREITSRAEIRTSARGVRIHLRARALNFAGRAKRRNASYPDMHRELTTVIAPEISKLARHGVKQAEREFREMRRSRKRRV